MEQSRLLQAFKALLTTAGLPAIRFHDLRHTAATLMMMSGVPAHVVQERLGHASVEITLGTYSHVLREMHQDAAEKMNELLK